MDSKLIYSLIKTDCGRSKYEELSSRKGFISFIRLMWFILIAIIKDWNLPNKIQDLDSNS